MKEKDSCDWEKANERRKLGNETIIENKTKKNKEIRNDCEAEDGEKNKKKNGKRYSDEIGRSKSSKVVILRKTGKRNQDDIDFGAEEETDNFNKEMKKKSKKKKQSEDSKAEEGNKDFVKDTKKEFKKKKKKQSKDSVAEEGNKDSTKDATKKRVKKQSQDLESEQNKMNSIKDGKKKGKKQKYCKNDEDMTTPSSKSDKRVKFSDQMEVFASEDEEIEDEEMEDEEEEAEAGGGELVRGKRFTKEEDELLEKAILEYIDNKGLGDKGLNMVLKSRSHPEVRGCWKYIAYALPWRPKRSVYNRSQLMFDRSQGKWTEKEIVYVKQFVEKHGPKWTPLAESLGKHRLRVRDAWRNIKFPNRGKWSREEYQTLFDLVNNDLRLKAFQEKKSRHGMLRDNIHWTAISDQLGTRGHSFCYSKWYKQLTSPMVAKGIWANVDDYRLLDELVRLDATCIDDVDWDNIVENRDGEICRKRWNQMVLHIGVPGSNTFAEQVEILSNRYCPDLAKVREDFDNRPFDDSEASPRK